MDKGESSSHRVFSRRAAVVIVLAVLNVGVLLWCLEHYQAHTEVENLSRLLSAVSIVVSVVFIVRAARRREPGLLISAAVSAAVCFAVHWAAWSIPLCPMCEGLTEADLGLLAHWIPCGP